jgi:probable H4MPT-linked C1 transfer pathway protein
MTVIGWDIGGVNTKMACVDGGRVRAVEGQPYELQRAPAALAGVLRTLAAAQPAAAAHAVTMTAELSQFFRTKREGVTFVLDAVEAAFPAAAIHVLTSEGAFLSPAEARAAPIAVAAANWAATARLAATQHPDALLVDIGTTSTDIIPIAAGGVSVQGFTDPDRLASGELVYTGAVRTPAEAMASHVPFGSGVAGVSAEGFALSGDVHVWRGDLAPADYTVPAPDGRPTTREFVRERLARVVCADREMAGDAQITAIADALAAAQVERVRDAVARVAARHPRIRTAVVTGLGAFIGERAARAAGLDVVPFAGELGDAAARVAPAACVALLLERTLRTASPAVTPALPTRPPRQRSRVETVVKLGGGCLAREADFESVLRRLAAGPPVLVVPGGGPFADAVRAADTRLALADDAAHWMAILGMDQMAHLIASRLPSATIVESPDDAAAALLEGRVPVLAPFRWLREADPLPHSWDVTSDSIAAWIAGAVGATRLVLVKPAGAQGAGVVDRWFARALTPQVAVSIVSADDGEGLARALSGQTASEPAGR